MPESSQSDLTLEDDPEMERAYLSALDDRLSLLAKKPGPTLESIVSDARGAFPTLVQERLQFLELASTLLPTHPLREVRSIMTGPELHPLDFEWYFTPECAEYLADVLTTDSGDVLSMGAPTVATAVARRGRRTVLLDNNPLIRQRLPSDVDSLEFCRCDLYSLLPIKTSFPIAFFDAPWYLESALSWLWQASQLVSPGGVVAFSLFPPLLRPRADDERHQILDIAGSIGEVTVHEECLLYETPLFEEEALVRCGLTLTTNWRRADLVLIRVSQKPDLSRPQVFRDSDEQWDSYIFGTQVVKLRRYDHDDASMILSPIPGCPDYVFPSVSLRVQRRRAIDLWTSRNRVARVGRRRLIAGILSELDRGMSLEESMRSNDIGSMDAKEREGLLASLEIILDVPLKGGSNATPHNCS